jgi:hypothetical protein
MFDKHRHAFRKHGTVIERTSGPGTGRLGLYTQVSYRRLFRSVTIELAQTQCAALVHVDCTEGGSSRFHAYGAGRRSNLQLTHRFGQLRNRFADRLVPRRDRDRRREVAPISEVSEPRQRLVVRRRATRDIWCHHVRRWRSPMQRPVSNKPMLSAPVRAEPRTPILDQSLRSHF